MTHSLLLVDATGSAIVAQHSSLIPPDPDDTVLFVTSGMHPLIPHLRGRPHPQSSRLHNLDTGMGFERLLMILQGVKSVYETDLFIPWTSELSGRWGLAPETLWRLAYHLRSCTAIVFDGVRPDNTGREYVLRRLLRRVLDRAVGQRPQRLAEPTRAGRRLAHA